MHTFFVLAAAALEILRVVMLCRDMKSLALEKGQPPLRWIIGTILIWWGIEIAAVAIWFYMYGWDLSIVIAVFIGIVTARVVFFFYKRDLSNRNPGSFEDKINEIGREK